MKISEIKFIKSVINFQKDYNPLKEEKRTKIFFLWRSNVGKSSLINSLLWVKELAFSWAKAWKTKTINIFEVNKNFECLDFPGYGFAVWGKENKVILRDMILDYLENNLDRNIKAILIIDAFVWPTKEDIEIFEYLQEKWINTIVIANKIDKANQKDLNKTIKKIEEEFNIGEFLLYSCKTWKYRDSTLNYIFC